MKKVKIEIELRPEIYDPENEMIKRVLKQFFGLSPANLQRSVVYTLKFKNLPEKDVIEKAVKEFLANPLIHRYRIEMVEEDED